MLRNNNNNNNNNQLKIILLNKIIRFKTLVLKNKSFFQAKILKFFILNDLIYIIVIYLYYKPCLLTLNYSYFY